MRHVPRRIITTVAAAAAIVPALSTSAWAAGPAPVSNLDLSSKDAAVIAKWAPSPDTSQAKVCWQFNNPPATPSDIGANCSGVLDSTSYRFDGVEGQSYGVSVFSYDATTSSYGSPVSGTVTAVDAPPLPVGDLQSLAPSYGGGYVQFTWTDSANHDTQDYKVSIREGLDTPEYDPVNDGSTTRREYSASTEPGKVYTIAVRVTDEGGHTGEPAVLHFTGRAPGLWAADDRKETIDRDQVMANASSVAASAQTDGHLRAIYVAQKRVWYTSRLRSAAWGQPMSVSGDKAHLGLRDPVIDSTKQGDVSAAWSGGQGVLDARRISGHWHRSHVTRNSYDRAAGTTIDGKGNIHVLVRRTSPKGGGLLLFTRDGKRWTKSRFDGSGRFDQALLTKDGPDRTVVVVDAHNGTERSTVRIAVMPTGHSSLPRARTILDRPRGATAVVPTSVAARSGRVTVALDRHSDTDGSDSDGVFTITVDGHSTSDLTRIPHTTANDTMAVVLALDNGDLVVSWRRTDPSWSPDIVGVWANVLTADGTGWNGTAPRRWSTSAYDVPLTTVRDDRGHTFAAYLTVSGDVTE